MLGQVNVICQPGFAVYGDTRFMGSAKIPPLDSLLHAEYKAQSQARQNYSWKPKWAPSKTRRACSVTLLACEYSAQHPAGARAHRWAQLFLLLSLSKRAVRPNQL